VLSLTNGIVDTTAHGKLVFGMFALMADYEAALISKAQKMYDSEQFTMADIASSCTVTRPRSTDTSGPTA